MSGYANPMQNPMLYAGAGAQQQDQYLQMMRAQMLAQQYAQAGEMPSSNEMAGNVVVRHSPLEYLSKTVAQNQAQNQQLKAAQMQMQLVQGMGQGATGGAASGSQGGGLGMSQDQQLQIARAQAMYGDVAAKALADSFAQTPDMKNAAASGTANPLDYNAANARNTALANAGMKPTTYTSPDGVTHQTTEAGLAGMASGGSPMVLGGKLPPIAANVPTQPVSPDRGSLTASERAIPTPPQEASITTNGSVGGMPLSGDANTKLASAVNEGMTVQSPAQAAGATEGQKNYQTYLQGINKRVAEGADNTRIMNAQEDLMAHFRPGAGEEELAQAAAALKALGGSDNLVNAVARGDQSAVGAVQAFSSMASIHAATQALEIMGNGGNGQPRIAASVLEEFKNNLSNPNKQEDAIRAINALSRQQYQSDFAEQQSALKDKGDPTTFQARYAAQINPGLVNGRDTSPAEAITKTAHVAAAQAPPPIEKRTVGMVVNSPNGPVKWTGTGWLKVQNAR